MPLHPFIKQYKNLAIPILGATLLYLAFAYQLERSNFLKLLLLYSGLFYTAWRIVNHKTIAFWHLAGIGVFFRLLFLPAIPNLSQDFYRFLWDGRLMLQGINPYLLTPEMYLQNDQTTIVAQANELYSGMGTLNGSHYSNYPPINQLCFAIGALFTGKSILGSVIVLRVLMILADIGILYYGKKLLEKLNLPSKQIFWYFLNPFVIIELTGNLHFEGVMLFFVIWALYLIHNGRWMWAGVALGLSVSVKLLPLLFLPLFYNYFIRDGLFSKDFWKLKKFYWVVLGTIIVTFAPFLSSEFLNNFTSTIALWFQNFEFNASVYYIIRWIGFQTIGWNIIESVGKILPLVVIAFLLALSFFRKNHTTSKLITALLLGVSFYFLLSTTVHPWYIATPLVLSIFTKYRFPIVWSFMVMFSYSAYGPDGFQENLGLIAMEYIVVIGFAIWELRNRPTQKSLDTI